jgi:hypothetical protein
LGIVAPAGFPLGFRVRNMGSIGGRVARNRHWECGEGAKTDGSISAVRWSKVASLMWGVYINRHFVTL